MNRIAEIREAAGITQAALYRKLGWKQSRLANYEALLRQPSLEDARRIVKALNALGAKTNLDKVFPPKPIQQPTKAEAA